MTITEILARNARLYPDSIALVELTPRKNFRKERFIPSDILDRLSPNSWVKAGSRDTTDRAREKVEAILKEHEPEHIPKDIARGLDTTLSDILKRHGITSTASNLR